MNKRLLFYILHIYNIQFFINYFNSYATHYFIIPLCLHAGEGMSELSLADRATIANMSPEYGATMGFFPVDHVTLQYLKLTGRKDETVSNVHTDVQLVSSCCFYPSANLKMTI